MSEDIASNPNLSRFFRTGPGVFFLRSFLDDPSIPIAFREPYFAPPRRRELRRERVLTLAAFGMTGRAAASYFIDIKRLEEQLARGRYRFAAPREQEHSPEGISVHSFVLVFHEEAVLSYRCGKFFPDTAPLKGKRSIGLGGAVYASDRDLLFDDMYGIIASGINELAYGIGLSKILSERARYDGEVKPCIGVLLPSKGGHPAVLHVVLAYECPPDFLPSKAALSVNDLRWLNVKNPANSLDGFDITSALLFTTGRVAKIRETARARDVAT